jgi:hypothetical protein
MLDIDAETELAVLLPAYRIPDQARITKRTGEQYYVLRHNITVYQADKSTPLNLEGDFLIGPNGSVNQIKQDTLLLWRVPADELVEQLQAAWEPIPQ